MGRRVKGEEEEELGKREREKQRQRQREYLICISVSQTRPVRVNECILDAMRHFFKNYSHKTFFVKK